MNERMPHVKTFSAIGVLVVLLAGAWYTAVHGGESTSPLDPVAPATEYTDDVFHFKLSYPADYAVREYAEDEVGARTIAFEGPSEGEGFQVFVVPYAGSSITPERFKTDDPPGVMKDAKEIAVDPSAQADGTPATSFIGYNDQMGATREVWLIHGGYMRLNFQPVVPGDFRSSRRFSRPFRRASRRSWRPLRRAWRRSVRRVRRS